MVNYDGYYELCAAVVKNAVLDWLDANKVIVSMDNPSLSKMTEKKIKAMRNTARSQVLNSYNCDKKNELEIAHLTRMYMESEYDKATWKRDECEAFFHSDLFILYSHGADGDGMLKAAKVALKRWVDGETHPIKSNFSYSGYTFEGVKR